MLALAVIFPDDRPQDLPGSAFQGALGYTIAMELSSLWTQEEELSLSARWRQWETWSKPAGGALASRTVPTSLWGPYLVAGPHTVRWAVWHPGGKAWALWRPGEEWPPGSCTHLWKETGQMSGNCWSDLGIVALDENLTFLSKYNPWWRVSLKDMFSQRKAQRIVQLQKHTGVVTELCVDCDTKLFKLKKNNLWILGLWRGTTL